MTNIAELKHRADIREVWSSLGGSELRRGRGQAFWRGGDGYSISLDAQKGVWFDFRDNVGGDVIALVETVKQCGFREAVEWLSGFTGVGTSELPVRTDNRPDAHDCEADRRWAYWWGRACEMLCELLLEELPCWHQERFPLTQLLARVRLGSESLVNEYRLWRERFPELTSGMARAGRQADASLQRRLMAWLGRYLSEPPRT
jgi:hypothetical protein